MSRPDAAASAALDADFIQPEFFAFLDIVGDPIRCTTYGRDIVPTGTGFAELDGQMFYGIRGDLVDVSPVRAKQGGTDRVTAKISGLLGLDQETLDQIGDRANWQGRVAMLWRMIRDTTGAQQGGIQHYYTGYMTALQIGGGPTTQTIEMTIEGWLAAFSQASNRTYLDQAEFDPDDHSAEASIAIANGISTSPATAVPLGGGWGPYFDYQRAQQK